MLDIQAGGWLPLDADLTMSTSRQVENQREHSQREHSVSKPSSENKKKKKIVMEGKPHWFQNLFKRTPVSESHRFRLVGLYAMSTLGCSFTRPPPVDSTTQSRSTKHKHQWECYQPRAERYREPLWCAPWTESGL